MRVFFIVYYFGYKLFQKFIFFIILLGMGQQPSQQMEKLKSQRLDSTQLQVFLSQVRT